MKIKVHLSPVRFFGIVAALTLNVSAAPVSFTTPGGTVTENFNQNLPGGAETFAWSQGTVFTGWYAQFDAPNAAAEPTPITNPPPSYRRTFGQSEGIRIYQWRANVNATDGALGAIPINDTGDVHFAIRLVNDTGLTLDQFSVGYTGQQWRITTSGPTTITVGFQYGELASDLTAGPWTGLSGLTFTSPHSNATVASNVGGTLAENSQVFAPTTVTGQSWAPEEELWIRFTVQNITGFSQGLAVDDFTFTAIPEPGTLALVLLAGLGAVAGHRRRRFKN